LITSQSQITSLTGTKTLVSDQGSHFVDKTLSMFNRILQARHHVVTA
jgi:hypothetical protein